VKAFLVAVVLLIALAGCGDKKVTAPILVPQYLPPSTPQNVLMNLQLAYSSRDSTEYKALFDDNYVGTSLDNSGGSPVTLTFYKSDEAAHISALAHRSSITQVALLYPRYLYRFTDGGDPAGWATIQMSQGFQVQIDDNPTSLFTPAIGDLNEFKFESTTPATGSPTDTTWKIIRWTEIHN
jgi:hypothetical protein